VYGIIKQHDAHISVTSRDGAGTSFRIYFPRCSPPQQVQKQVVTAGRDRAVVAETILLVEDNGMVREMAREMLEVAGFRVIAVGGPQAAIRMLADNSSRIDLLVSDVVMPDMSGPELYEQLVIKIPDLKVMYISGYPINPATRGVAPVNELLYLQKPFTAQALLERVMQVLQ
jgi:CheY-like chemotaxis protein